MDPADVLVRIEHVDVGRAGLVRLARDRTGERRVLEQGVDRERLPRLQVEPDPDGQARVLLEPVVGRGHGGSR